MLFRQNYLQALFVSLLFLSSCTAHMTGLEIAGSFTPLSLAQGNLIWAGLENGVATWTAEEKIQYSASAEQAIRRTRTDLTVSGQAELTKRLGETVLRQILDNFNQGKSLDPSALRQLKSGAMGSRYILFGRLLEDNVLRHRSSITERKDGKQQDFTVYKIVREIVVYAEVYDLDALKVVWSGSIKKSKSKTNKNRHYHRSNIAMDIFNELLEDVYFGEYPKPASLKKMINRAFREIAANLPR